MWLAEVQELELEKAKALAPELELVLALGKDLVMVKGTAQAPEWAMEKGPAQELGQASEWAKAVVRVQVAYKPANPATHQVQQLRSQS